MQYKESQNLELKASFGEWKEIIQTLGAFANQKGGQVIVGMSDNGQPTGLSMGKKTIEDFVNKIKNNTDPILYPSINILDFGPGEIAEIEIKESDYKPVFVFDRAFIRVGKTNQKMSSAEIKNLIKRYNLTDFDSQLFSKPIKDIDLDIDLIQETNQNFFKFKQSTPKQILKELKLTQKQKISNAGYFCFARQINNLPNAVIKAARFKGDDMTHFIDMKNFDHNLIRSLEEVMDFIKRHINLSVEIGNKLRRKEKWEYPIEAIREALVNAIIHRDYSAQGNIQVRIFDSKLEIWSPGLLPKEITIDDIWNANTRSIARNKLLIQIFYKLGLMENWGSGFSRIISACQKFGIQAPQIEEVTGAFVMRFYKKKSGGIKSGGIKSGGIKSGGIKNGGINQVLDFLEKNPGQSTKEIAKNLKIPLRSIERYLQKLKEQNKIEFRGSKKTGGYFLKN